MEGISESLGILYDPYFLRHLTGGHHPERPSRLMAITDALGKKGILHLGNLIHPRIATPEELAYSHHPDYISLLQREAERCALHGFLDGSYQLSTGDVQICPDSYQAAALAAGGAMQATDALYKREYASVFCALRPPGHHACYQKGMGFCLFNNAVLAARHAQKKWGARNVLIIDWDVHHGNGTQDLVWFDPTLFYFSTHQWPLYPGTGAREETGAHDNILNCPIEAGGASRRQVIQAFKDELPGFFSKANPDFVIISCGFDAHQLDPLGGMNLTKEDFGELTRQVMALAGGRPILSLLEGGYSLEALAESAVEHCYFLGCSKL
jgi:acetoin utilization deacetylase AcuC-like enzyme